MKFKPDTVDLFEKTVSDLVSIRSLSGQEKDMADHIQGRLKSFGLKVERDEEDNVWTVLEPGIPGDPKVNTLHLNGHTDTVPPVEGWTSDPWKPEVIGNGEKRRLVGLGASDMKSGLAVLIHLTEHFSRNPLKRLRLFVSFTICEEKTVPGKRNGVARLVESHPGRWSITTEPSCEASVTTITLGCQGNAVVKIILKGLSAHSSTPERGINAIHAAGKICGKIQRLNDSFREIPLKDGLFARPTVAVTGIQGGSADNIIPEHCEVTVSRRLAPGETLKVVEAEVAEWVKDLEGVTASWKISGGTPACHVQEDGPLLKSAQVASQSLFGKTKYCWMRGRGDMVLFSKVGMDVLNMGPGSLDQAHVSGESVLLDDLPRTASLLAETIQQLDQWLVENSHGKGSV